MLNDCAGFRVRTMGSFPKRGSISPTLANNRSLSPKVRRGSATEENEDFYTFNKVEVNKQNQQDFQKTIKEAVVCIKKAI